MRPSPVVAVAERGGIATRAEILDAGVQGIDISRAVRAAELIRVRRAHYAVPEAPRDAVSAVRVGGRLGCVSALASYGIWTRASPVAHVALPANAARLRTNRALVRTDEPLTPDRARTEVALHWTDVPRRSEGGRAPGGPRALRARLTVSTSRPDPAAEPTRRRPHPWHPLADSPRPWQPFAVSPRPWQPFAGAPAGGIRSPTHHDEPFSGRATPNRAFLRTTRRSATRPAG